MPLDVFEHDEILAALRRYTSAGCKCFFLRGNRDFLVGPRFVADTGAILLKDETLTEVEGTPALLMHGDTLCTDDRAYQRYRRLVHRPAVQALYLGLPVRVRSAIATVARRRSTAANAGKPASIMDVNPAAVTDALRRHGVRLLIHGHTHRPAVHALEVDGQPARRVVLGAWYDAGCVLRWTTAGPNLQTLPFGKT